MNDSLTYSEYAEFAEAAARAAGEITLQYFQKLPGVEYKADGSPVTVADRESEELLRAWIEERFPEHGMLGEEFGLARPEARLRWLLDPIDGTQSYIRGVPLYGVMLALVEIGKTDGLQGLKPQKRGHGHGGVKTPPFREEDDPVVGVVHFPALRETVTAWRGGGCWWSRSGGRTRARVSEVARLEDAVLLGTDPKALADGIKHAAYERLRARVKMERGWGDCYAYLLVATGRAEIALDAALSEWDAAPLVPIIEEAGGKFTDWRGRRTIAGGDGFATNAILNEPVRRLLNAED